MLIDFRQLFPKYGIKPKGVLHIGANVGEEAPVYHELGIKKVLWIEGNEELIPKLAENVSKYGQEWMCQLIGDEHGKEWDFNISNNAGQSSSILQLGTHKQQHPNVHFTHSVRMQTKRIDILFENNFPKELDFLNIDIQGAELKALRGMGALLHQFKWAYIEVNQAQVYIDCPHVNDLDLFLNGFGFKRVETKWCGGWGDGLFIKR